MKRDLVYYGDPRLREKAQPVGEITNEIRQIVEDMVDTMHAHNGAGLAGPQVGVMLRIFVLDTGGRNAKGEWEHGTPLVMINPQLSDPHEEMQFDLEGCLSIPKVWGHVDRPMGVFVEYTDLDGKTQKVEVTGYRARQVMHENDHLNGVLFLDRLSVRERKRLQQELRELKKDLKKKKKS